MPRGVYSRKSALERFHESIDHSDQFGCHLWKGAKSDKGYGHLSINDKMVKAHRFAWELANGPIPVGLSVCHHCDNPPCVNPKHLFLGTHADNMQDMRSKGRCRPGTPGTNTARRGIRVKLTEENVREIRARHASGSISRNKLAIEFEVTPRIIGLVVKRLSWKSVA